MARLDSALAQTSRQLRSLMDRVASKIGEKESQILQTQLMMLGDPMLIGQVKDRIWSAGLPAEEAVDQVVCSTAEKFLALRDGYLKERSPDNQDVGRRLLTNLTHSHSEEDARGDQGIIVARALNIVMVAGVKGVLDRVQEGDPVIVDGGRGEVIVAPDPSATELYRRRQREQRTAQQELAAASHLPAITRDGFRLEVAANIGGLWEVPAALAAGAESIGVLRTEFLFLNRQTLPSEQEQLEAYQEVLSQMAPRRVVVRTLDVGGDKQLPGCQLPREPNPALGLRAIRLSLQRQELFRTQIRALLRAARFGNLAILLPIVSDVDELRRAKQIIAEIRSELGDAGEAPLLGCMVETPAAALLAQDLAGEAGFLSIGTNDLT